jgi:hypothetical protein
MPLYLEEMVVHDEPGPNRVWVVLGFWLGSKGSGEGERRTERCLARSGTKGGAATYFQ